MLWRRPGELIAKSRGEQTADHPMLRVPRHRKERRGLAVTIVTQG